MYCAVQDGRERQAFYSAVFVDNYLTANSRGSAFHAYVDARYGETSSSAVALCFFEASHNEASSESQRKAAADRRDGYRVVRTPWPRASRSLEPQGAHVARDAKKAD